MCWNWNADVLRMECWTRYLYRLLGIWSWSFNWNEAPLTDLGGYFTVFAGKLAKYRDRVALPQGDGVPSMWNRGSATKHIKLGWNSLGRMEKRFHSDHVSLNQTQFWEFFSHDVILISWFDFLLNMDNQIQILMLFVLLRFVMDTSRWKPLLFFINYVAFGISLVRSRFCFGIWFI